MNKSFNFSLRTLFRTFRDATVTRRGQRVIVEEVTPDGIAFVAGAAGRDWCRVDELVMGLKPLRLMSLEEFSDVAAIVTNLKNPEVSITNRTPKYIEGICNKGQITISADGIFISPRDGSLSMEIYNVPLAVIYLINKGYSIVNISSGMENNVVQMPS